MIMSNSAISGQVTPTSSVKSNSYSNNMLSNIFKGGNYVLSAEPNEDDMLVQKFQMYQSTQDLLALSVCWKKLRNDITKSSYIRNLLDPELFKIVSPDDVVQANNIRDYYSKKLMMVTLTSDMPLSNFRKDLNIFISSDGKTFREEMIPLAYSLPELYEYDITLESTVEKAKELDVNLKGSEHMFLNKIHRQLRKNKFYDYWFLDDTKKLVCLSVDNKNLLIPFLDNALKNNNGIINLPSHQQKRVRDGLHYFQIIRLN